MGLELLWELLAQDSPVGDEGPLADWLWERVGREWPQARRERLGDSVLVLRGERPSVALFAHLDTTGWTLGYDRHLISLGHPDPAEDNKVRPAHSRLGETRKLHQRKNGQWTLKGRSNASPGTRWVYATQARQVGEEVCGPYLDNRAGVWAALQVLTRCENVALALTTGEEQAGQGAYVCARRLGDGYGIRQALIADLTWDTKRVHCGKGPAVSLRDSSVPRQRFLDKVLTLADASGLPFQREIEDSGGSDGGYITRSGVPLDWVFVGAPEKRPHTSQERVNVADLQGMVDLLAYLVNGLTAQE